MLRILSRAGRRRPASTCRQAPQKTPYSIVYRRSRVVINTPHNDHQYQYYVIVITHLHPIMAASVPFLGSHDAIISMLPAVAGRPDIP